MTHRICIWTIFPNHYLASFFRALRAMGVDLQVRYYQRVPGNRLSLGWEGAPELPPGEAYVDESAGAAAALETVDGCRDAIHVLPGYGDRFLLGLLKKFDTAGMRWVHWSESSRRVWWRWGSLPLKRWYAAQVNAGALGAFGMGHLAFEDFSRWGIRSEKVAFLPYVTEVIPPGIAEDEACRDFRRGRPAFVFIGALNHRKGVDILLEAFQRVAGRGSESVLMLVGDDRSNGRYAASARERGISEKVLFRGPVPPAKIGRVLQPGCMLVLPSRRDGWGVVLNEGASAGLPLIASDRCGAAHHLIEMGLNGFRVEAGSARSLANAMSAYVSDLSLLQIHGARSREVAREFTPEANGERFLGALASWQAMRAG